jgi:hypothetical protein
VRAERALALFTLALALASTRVAGAQVHATSQCLTTPVEGQKLRKADKLLGARDKFTVCAHDNCPKEIVQDCTQWAREVDESIPSVVLAARDPSGHDLLDARVSIDGTPAVAASPRAIDLDPGVHRFVFQRPGSPDVPLDVLLREGEKNREIAATIGTAASLPPESIRQPPPPPVVPVVLEREVPVSAWVLGGVGVAALASFGTFGAIALGQRGSDHCDSGCTPAQKTNVETKYIVADASLGVAVVALAVATWVYFAHPKVAKAGAAWADPGFAGALGMSF